MLSRVDEGSFDLPLPFSWSLTVHQVISTLQSLFVFRLHEEQIPILLFSHLHYYMICTTTLQFAPNLLIQVNQNSCK